MSSPSALLLERPVFLDCTQWRAVVEVGDAEMSPPSLCWDVSPASSEGMGYSSG